MAVTHRICPLCEATCGLVLTIDDLRVTAARGDRDDVFSHGFVCPKGVTFPDLVNDPDRITGPLLRVGAEHRPIGWDAAFALVDEKLSAVVAEHGRQALALYLGNPNVHTLAGGLRAGDLARALGSPNVFSASTVDQMPKHVSCGLMFGDPHAIPVADLDRTDLLVVVGANPWESNGSLCTAPGFPQRVRALRKRGGRMVVVDPRRTRTAQAADQHLRVRPGSDALLLFGVAHTLFAEGLVRPGPHIRGLDGVRELCAGFPADVVAERCGVAAAEIRALARALAAAPTAAVYGRIGTTAVAFGTLTSWLVDVLNALTGNLDRPGGAMFPLAPHVRRSGGGKRPFRLGRWHSRVRGLPEVNGELPVATLADEILTPGPGQVRALVTVAGNPALSAPDSGRLHRALGDLAFMVSVDPYLNETTRHADLVLPPPPPSHSPHYDIAFSTLAIRNTARFSPAPLPPLPGRPDECDILARLTLIARGAGADADPATLDHEWLARELGRAVADDASAVHGRDPAELATLLHGDTSAERRLDAMLRLGVYGDGFGADPEGLSLARLLDHPHGIDLGPLTPRLPEVLRTASGQVELCPEPIVAEVARLRATLDTDGDALVLIGRRHLRSNNSWQHNVPALVGGSNRCSLHVHPDDAKLHGLGDGDTARIRSRVGAVETTVELTTDLLPGVVSLPHGWGHAGSGQRVAAAQAGVNSNLLTDPEELDPLSGNAVLNGIAVTLERVGP